MREESLESQLGSQYDVRLYSIAIVLGGEVTGHTVLYIHHFDSSEQREDRRNGNQIVAEVCQATGEEGLRQYGGSKNGQDGDWGNIYGNNSTGLIDLLNTGG